MSGERSGVALAECSRYCPAVALDCKQRFKHQHYAGTQAGRPDAGTFHLGWSDRNSTSGIALVCLRETKPAPTIRSYIPPPPEAGFDFTGDFSGPPAISPDGLALAFCARTPKERDAVWVQSLSDLTAKKLEGTEGSSFPFWSGDGKFLGFFADGHLKKVPAAGGPVITLADAPNARGGAWNQDNIIIFEPDYRESLWRISAAGGVPTQLTKMDSTKHTTQRWPQFLPDGKHFLFFATNHSGGSEQGLYMDRWTMVLTNTSSTGIHKRNMPPDICFITSNRS